MSSTVVEFDHFAIEVRWHCEGRYYPASGTSPATCPVPRVDGCTLRMGDFTSIVPFALLPESMCEYIHDELLAEISGDYIDHETDFAELI